MRLLKRSQFCQQHIGAPCKPVLQKGDRVKVGQVIGDSDQYVSAPIHSGVSGKVAKMDIILTYDGRNVPVMIIESDGENEIHEDVKPPKVGNLNEFVKAIRASGLVGLGGAGFPTHVKLNLPNEADIDTLIVNAVECEPYITSDFREALEHTEHVIRGTEIIGEFLKIPNLIIGVEDNKPESIEILSQAAKGTKIQVQPLIRGVSARSRENADFRVDRKKSSFRRASFRCRNHRIKYYHRIFSKYLKRMPLVKRRVTVDGTAVKNRNVEVVVVPPYANCLLLRRNNGGNQKGYYGRSDDGYSQLQHRSTHIKAKQRHIGSRKRIGRPA